MMLDDESLASNIRINTSKFAQDFSWDTILKKMFEFYKNSDYQNTDKSLII
jgi:hypothetical protein